MADCLSPKDIEFYLTYNDGKFFWKERPLYDFKTNPAWKTWNTRYAYKEAGTVTYNKVRDEYRVGIRIKGKRYLRSRLVYILHKGNIPDELQVDHKNGNSLDDEIDNLRLVTNKINSYNCKKFKNNISGTTGVYYHRENDMWYSQAKEDDKTIQLYYGPDQSLAVKAHKDWELNNIWITDRHGI